MIKEIKKFYPVVKNHKFNSVYSLYMKGIYNNRFKEYAEQFEFITNTQMANNSIIFIHCSSLEELLSEATLSSAFVSVVSSSI